MDERRRLFRRMSLWKERPPYSTVSQLGEKGTLMEKCEFFFLGAMVYHICCDIEKKEKWPQNGNLWDPFANTYANM